MGQLFVAMGQFVAKDVAPAWSLPCLSGATPWWIERTRLFSKHHLIEKVIDKTPSSRHCRNSAK